MTLSALPQTKERRATATLFAMVHCSMPISAQPMGESIRALASQSTSASPIDSSNQNSYLNATSSKPETYPFHSMGLPEDQYPRFHIQRNYSPSHVSSKLKPLSHSLVLAKFPMRDGDRRLFWRATKRAGHKQITTPKQPTDALFDDDGLNSQANRMCNVLRCATG